MRNKDKVFVVFQDWLAVVENQMDQKLKYVQSDNGESINLMNSPCSVNKDVSNMKA